MSKRIIGIAIVVIVIALGGYWFATGSDAAEHTAVAERDTLDVTIQTIGTLQTDDASVIRPSVAGVIDQLAVEAGDRVTEGDIIAILDLQAFDRVIEDAEAQLEQAEFALQLAEERAGQNPDDRQLAQEVLTTTLAVEQARRSLEDAADAKQEAVVRAPHAGRVIDVTARTGDPVSASQPIATVAQPDDLELVAQVDELDLPNVQPGAAARFRVDAYPATEIVGTVVSTAPQADLQGGASVFATTIEFDQPPELDLRPGMNAAVTIVTDERSGVLLIPETALKTVGERNYVTVVTDNGRVDREVILGHRGNGQVEVVSGLSEGDEVVIR